MGRGAFGGSAPRLEWRLDSLAMRLPRACPSAQRDSPWEKEGRPQDPSAPGRGGPASLQGNALPSRTPSSLPRGTGRSPPPLRWAGNAGPWASVGVGGRRAVAHCPLDSCVHIHKYVCVCVCVRIHIILGDYRIMMSPYFHLSFALLCWKAANGIRRGRPRGLLRRTLPAAAEGLLPLTFHL